MSHRRIHPHGWCQQHAYFRLRDSMRLGKRLFLPPFLCHHLVDVIATEVMNLRQWAELYVQALMCSTQYLFITPTASDCQAGDISIQSYDWHTWCYVCVCVCVCPSVYEWCVGGAMNGQRGVCSHRHHSSSEMRSAIYSTARLLNWEKKEVRKRRWVSEFPPRHFFNLIFF